jgi:molybdopterin-guanine dinucleotide biosynthesis protein A
MVLLANDASLAQQVNGIRFVFDPEPHAGVLPALAAGLDAATGEICLAVACDMPFVSAPLFDYLLALQRQTDADVVIARTTGFVEPMHAVYRRAVVLTAIRAALGRGEQRMISYFQDVQVREVAEAEWAPHAPGGTAFFIVKTPAELAEARRMASA